MIGRKTTTVLVCLIVLVFGPQLVSAAGPIGPGSPQPIAHGTGLSHADPVLTFAGEFQNPTPLPTLSNPDPTICVSECQQWSLKVATSQPFLASIHNANNSIDDGLNLYVYDPSGNQVGSSSGVGSNGQAVAVTKPVQGSYTLVVTVTYAYDATTKYLGEARIMAPPSWSSPRCAKSCPLLPRLRPLPPSDIHVDGIPPAASTPLGFPFPFTIPTGNSCYIDETAATGARRCLRFTSVVENDGVGLLHLRLPWVAPGSGGAQSGFIPGGCHTEQLVQWTDGKQTIRPAGPCLYHPQHAHFHYRDFVSFTLERVTPNGSTGPSVGKLRSLKESFCLADDDYFGFGTTGPNGPRTYTGQPGCNLPSGLDPTGAWVEMGMTPGWADVYTWDTPSQYIDITNVPPGVYEIVTKTNPGGLLDVAGPTSVCASTRVRITPTDAKELGSDPHAPCP
jgi:hypothetical protein